MLVLGFVPFVKLTRVNVAYLHIFEFTTTIPLKYKMYSFFSA